MTVNFEIEQDLIAEQNQAKRAWLAEDFEYLGSKLNRRNIDIESLVEKARGLQIAIPSWGVGTGGTRFARFPGPGEPRGIYEKLEDCSTINKLVRSTPSVSLHIPGESGPEVQDLPGFRGPENPAGSMRSLRIVRR